MLRDGCLALVFVVCCVGRGLCDGLITRSEETCHVCVCPIVGGLETSIMRRSERELDYCATEKIQQTMYKGFPDVQDVTSCSVTNLP